MSRAWAQFGEVNLISTQALSWKADCEAFWSNGKDFQVHDVTEREHWEFVQCFGRDHSTPLRVNGSTVTFFTPSARRRTL